MRLSADPNSAYYHPWAHTSFVSCDGEILYRVVEACEEEGWADIMVNESGHLRRERMFGDIEIFEFPVFDGTAWWRHA